MKAYQEAIERVALKQRVRMGTLSDEAFAELKLAVQKNPTRYMSDNSDYSFFMLADVLATNAVAAEGEEFLDDAAYEKAHTRRLNDLRAGCKQVVDLDETCIDAATILALTEPDASATLEQLLDLKNTYGKDGFLTTAAPEGTAEYRISHASDETPHDEQDLWSDVFARPRLRLYAACTQAFFNTTRYVPARKLCEHIVELTPEDPLGVRNTWALICARLEDEQDFNHLDALSGRPGNAWFHLARTLLLFKLDRMDAARRALRGYRDLCRGGAYALLRPSYVDTYLPDRPAYTKKSFEESCLAVHEADPILVDTPDFITWCGAQNGFAAEAQRFANEHDLEW